MKIEISDKTKFHTALSLANRHSYYDALCLFAQVESYESLLNQVACLCAMEDLGFAVDVYRFTKQKYVNTHAVYADTVSFGEVTEPMLSFAEPSVRYAREHDGTTRANAEMLVQFDYFDGEEYSAPDLDYVADTALYDDPKFAANNFYDIKSTQYFDSLRINMEKCIMEGDEKGAKKYSKRLLDLDTNHLPTLEAQISISLFTEDFKRGVVYARRLAETDGGSHAAIGGAIEIIMRADPHRHLEILKKLMYKALAIIDDITDYDLEDYIYIATSFVYDLEMAYKFARALYKDYKYTTLEALKMCACAFYNYGDTVLAKEAAISLCRAVPRSCYARILAEYIRKTPYAKNQTPMDVPPRVFRHFCLPTKIALYANQQLCRQLDANLILDDTALFYVSVLALHCKYFILTNQQQEYYQFATFLRALVRSCDVSDESKYMEFAKTQLFATMGDQIIESAIIARLIESQVKDKIFIGLTNGNYQLDFSKIERIDELYSEAFAICAALVQIDDPQKFNQAYKEVCSLVKFDLQDETLGHQLAFALLCICIKRFAELPEAEFFAEGEYRLYRQYRAAKKEKSKNKKDE